MIVQGLDTEASELRALAERQGFVRYLEQARQLQERQRDEAERELDAWKKFEAAVEAKLSIQAKLTMYFMLALNSVACIGMVLFHLIRWLL
jgi:hypothetical protein